MTWTHFVVIDELRNLDVVGDADQHKGVVAALHGTVHEAGDNLQAAIRADARISGF